MIIPLSYTVFFIIAYKKDPSTYFNKKIIFLIVLYLPLTIINTVSDLLFPTPNFENTLNIDFVTNAAKLLNKNYINFILLLIPGICWIFFTYYFTSWFNEKFSNQNNKIKIYYYASLVEIVGTLLLIIGLIQIMFLLTDIEKVGHIVSSDVASYNNSLGIASVGAIIVFLGNICELIAFYRMYNRIFKKKIPINQPYTNPFQNTNFRPYFPPPLNNQVLMNASQMTVEERHIAIEESKVNISKAIKILFGQLSEGDEVNMNFAIETIMKEANNTYDFIANEPRFLTTLVKDQLTLFLEDNPNFEYIKLKNIVIKKKQSTDYNTSIVTQEHPKEPRELHDTVQCGNCKNKISKIMDYCPYCGTKVAKCQICKFPIHEDQAQCSNCNSLFHRNHLKEYLKIKGTCPICNSNLKDYDI